LIKEFPINTHIVKNSIILKIEKKLVLPRKLKIMPDL